MNAVDPDRAPARVASDLACLRCGYNLRTLPHSARCPECGADVLLSLRGDALHFSDAEWLDRLAHGLTILVVVLAANCIATQRTALRASPGPMPGEELGRLICGIVLAVGSWLLTTPEPRRIADRNFPPWRGLVRWTASAAVCLHMAAMILPRGGPARGLGRAALFAELCYPFLLLLYVRQLARRLPGTPHGSTAGLLAMLSALVPLLVPLEWVRAWWFGRPVPLGAVAPLACGFMVLMIAMILFLDRVRSAVKGASHDARAGAAFAWRPVSDAADVAADAEVAAPPSA